MEEFEVKALQSFPHPSSPWLRFVDDTCCHQQGRTQPRPAPAHQQPGPTHPVHSGAHTTRITTILGHPSNHTTRQHIQHHSLQEAHTHRPIPPLGQQPPHYCQTKCIQHPSPQSPKQCLQPRKTWKRNSHTSKQPSTTASSPHGASTSGSTSSTSHNLLQLLPTATTTTTTTTHPTATNTKQP